MTEVEKGAACPQCGHPFDPHLFVATGSSPLGGGVILCHLRGCHCISTWSAGKGARDQVRIPGDRELGLLRASVQTRD